MGNILQSLQKVNEELQAIKKNKEGYGYKFRGIDQVLNCMSPLFKKHKILVSREIVDVVKSFRKDDRDRQVNMVMITFRYLFTSTDDNSVFSSMGIGEGEDRGDKATSCAISNSYKYVIFELFNIATEDQQDSDMKFAKENQGNAPKKKSEKKQEKGVDKLEKSEDNAKEKPKRRFKRPDAKKDEDF